MNRIDPEFRIWKLTAGIEKFLQTFTFGMVFADTADIDGNLFSAVPERELYTRDKFNLAARIEVAQTFIVDEVGMMSAFTGDVLSPMNLRHLIRPRIDDEDNIRMLVPELIFEKYAAVLVFIRASLEASSHYASEFYWTPKPLRTINGFKRAYLKDPARQLEATYSWRTLARAMNQSTYTHAVDSAYEVNKDIRYNMVIPVQLQEILRRFEPSDPIDFSPESMRLTTSTLTVGYVDADRERTLHENQFAHQRRDMFVIRNMPVRQVLPVDYAQAHFREIEAYRSKVRILKASDFPKTFTY